MTDPQWPRERVADELRARIKAGILTGKLPSRLDLAAELGVASKTVDAAMQILRAEGLIVARPGLGTFVSRQQP